MQYFEEMDQHAVWCRDAQLFANMLAEGDRFDHAQRFRDALDETERGGPVAQVIRVSSSVKSSAFCDLLM